MIVFSGCLMRCRCIIGPSVHGPQSARNRPVFASARGPRSARPRAGSIPSCASPGRVGFMGGPGRRSRQYDHPRTMCSARSGALLPPRRGRTWRLLLGILRFALSGRKESPRIRGVVIVAGVPSIPRLWSMLRGSSSNRHWGPTAGRRSFPRQAVPRCIGSPERVRGIGVPWLMIRLGSESGFPSPLRS